MITDAFDSQEIKRVGTVFLYIEIFYSVIVASDIDMYKCLSLEYAAIAAKHWQ